MHCAQGVYLLVHTVYERYTLAQALYVRYCAKNKAETVTFALDLNVSFEVASLEEEFSLFHRSMPLYRGLLL